MDRVPVSSSNIASVGYDASSLLLEVEFSNGRVYHYFDVAEMHFDALVSAGSVGGYFNQNIKPFHACAAT
ncbi:KTSC domain-containing protein [Blastococcus xanthinilyticus]|uniref:KTSC domain-containing protein n=1 Tax=Blastococcus xanthinilyticus TaxID=1564164 RepID=A0A5S5CR43_9ACTN|nr:KTSC domain-containing protein [Blastococcus xanthinilyticus]TYP84659.1 KTSC domain-containing protein [Blastococcus xanthinilyticus]